MDIALKIIYGLIAIGILIIVHEMGHFLLAKYFKVRVETFSIGMGPAIIKRKKGETVYQIGTIPMGGFCKLAGEEPSDNLTGASDELYSKPPIQRLGIIFAGPFFNYLFGIIMFIIVMLIGMEKTTFTNQVSIIDKIKTGDKEIISPAKKAGLKNQDKIIKIDGQETPNWSIIQNKIIRSKDNEKRIFTVNRNNKIIDIPIFPKLDADTGASRIGILPFRNSIIESLKKEGPAEKSGLKINDEIIRVDNRTITGFDDLKEYVSRQPGKLLNVQVKRENKILSFQVKTENINGIGMMGAGFGLKTIVYISRSKNIFTAMADGFNKGTSAVKDIIHGLVLMFSGKINMKKAAKGPIQIVYYAGEIAKSGGIINFIFFIGYISIALALFNLLPIPAVDGSYILIFLFELLSRRKLNYKVIQFIQYAAFIALIGLFLLIAYNDILQLWKSSPAVEAINSIVS